MVLWGARPARRLVARVGNIKMVRYSLLGWLAVFGVIVLAGRVINSESWEQAITVGVIVASIAAVMAEVVRRERSS